MKIQLYRTAKGSRLYRRIGEHWEFFDSRVWQELGGFTHLKEENGRMYLIREHKRGPWKVEIVQL